MSERKRGIICAYCGMAWGYEGESPTPELIKEACDHESICEKNPYTAQIRNLKQERDEVLEQNAKLRDIAERAVNYIREVRNLSVIGDWREIDFIQGTLRAELNQIKEGAK